MTRVLLMEATPRDPGVGLVTVRASTALRDAGAGILSGSSHLWLPAIAREPRFSIDVFGSELTGQLRVDYGAIGLRFGAALGNDTWSRFVWDGAPIKLWRGIAGQSFASFTQILDGRSGPLERDSANAGLLTLRGPEADLDRPLLTARYAGTGAAEGNAALKGVPKPWLSGVAEGVSGVLIDPQKWIWQLHGYGPIDAVTAAYELGLDKGPPAADFASHAALDAATLATDEWATALAVGMVRFGGEPAGRVVFDARGAKDGANFPRRAASIAAHLIRQAGVPSGKVSAASAAAVDGGFSYDWGLVVTGEERVGDLVRKAMADIAGYAFPDGGGVWRFGRWLPAKTPTVLSRARDRVPLVKTVKQVAAAAPVGEVRVGARRCWSVHGEGDISQALLEALQGVETDVAVALAELDRIGADGWLHPAEKLLVIKEKATLDLRATQVRARMVALSLSVSALDAARTALDSYLAGLSPAWNATSGDTAVVRATWNANWQAVYDEIAKGEKAVSEEDARRAEWAAVGGSGKPQDGATRNVFKGVHSTAVAYDQGDEVATAANDEIYVAITTVPVGIALSNATYWSLKLVAGGGAPGLNSATVFLFQRTSTATPPALPSNTVTYTFATGVASGANNGWVQSMPTTGGAYRWQTTATAANTGATDDIAPGKWAPAAITGADGAAADPTVQRAIITLYRRSATTPALPSATATYTHATGVITGVNNGWTTVPPATDGNPLWATLASAVGTGATDDITAGEWTAAQIYVQDGSDGNDGADGADADNLFDTFGYADPAALAERWTAGSINQTGGVVNAGKFTALAPLSDSPGGAAVRFGENSGDDQVALTLVRRVPYSAEDLYAVEFDVEHPETGTNAAFFAGVAAYDSAGGVLSGNGARNYVAASGVPQLAGRYRYRGYFQGVAGSGFAVAPNPESPSPLRTGAVTFSPYILMQSRSAGTSQGRTIVHSVRWWRVLDNTPIPLGDWNSGTTYRAGNVVSYLGRSFMSRTNGNLNNTPPATATSNSFWLLVADRGADGTDGADGDDGVNGTRTAILDVYRWAASPPVSFPSGTSTYTWATGQFTAPATLNGWSLTPPAPVLGQTLYIARQVFADTGTSATSIVTWSTATASPLSASGGNGQRFGLLELYRWSAAAPVTYPAGTSTYTWATGAFTLPATPNGWALTPGAAVPGQTLWGISVVISDALTTATSNRTWDSTTVYPVGYAGANGADGDDGRSVAELTIYRRLASPPTNPTGGSFNFGTQVLTPPAGWTSDIPANDGNPLYAAVGVATVIGPTGTATPAWGPAVLALQDAQSVNAVFRRLATLPATPAPSIGVPALWSDTPPAGADRLWVSYGSRPSPVVNWTWGTPAPVEGETGAPGVTAAGVAPITVAATADGTIKAGQLPQTRQMLLVQGATVVTSSATWSVLSSSNVTISVNGSGLVTLTGLSANTGSATIRGVLAGANFDLFIDVRKARDGSPALSVGVTPTFPSSGTLTTLGTTADMALPAGRSALLSVNADWEVSAGTSTGTFRMQYSVDGGGSWITMGADEVAAAIVLEPAILLMDRTLGSSGSARLVRFRLQGSMTNFANITAAGISVLTAGAS